MALINFRHISLYKFKQLVFGINGQTPVVGDFYYLFGGTRVSENINMRLYLEDSNAGDPDDDSYVSSESAGSDGSRIVTIKPGQTWIYKRKRDGDTTIEGWFLFSTNDTHEEIKEDIEKMIEEKEKDLSVDNHILQLTYK